MDWTAYFQLGAAIIGIVGVVTGAAVYTRSRLSFELLRGDLADCRARVAMLREEKAELAEKAARLEGELGQMKQRVTMLEDLATRAPDVATLVGEVRTLAGIVRSDYAHLAPELALLREQRIGGPHGRPDA